MDSMSPASVLGALNSISSVLNDIICGLKPSAGQQILYRLPGPLKIQAITTHNEEPHKICLVISCSLSCNMTFGAIRSSCAPNTA